jgi:DNA-binding transcriptional LysR family regulator
MLSSLVIRVFASALWMLWPSNRHASPKLRVLIDYFRDHML